ncbi:MAG: crossover junction endodeoxyribonuclease RuvC [Armatimonadota bacterium]
MTDIEWEHPNGSDSVRRIAYAMDLSRLIRGFNPTNGEILVCIETQFSAQGQRGDSILRLAELRGVLDYVARVFTDAETVGVTPAAAKLALTGTGGAEKQRMIAYAQERLGEDLLQKEQHVADALGIALAGKRIYGRPEQAVLLET